MQIVSVDTILLFCITVIGADILDQTGQDTMSFGKLEMTNVPYELTPKQKRFFEITRHVNQYMREEYHAVQELLWLTGHSPILGGMPQR